MTPPTKSPANPDSAPPSPTFLRRLDAKSGAALGKFLNMERKPKSQRLICLKEEQYDKIRKIESGAIAEFTGDLTQLEAALGMLRMGHFFGWKVLYLIHSKKTIRNYESILGIRIRDVFEETGPHSYRSVGLKVANMFSNFWKVAGGDIKIPHKQESI